MPGDADRVIRDDLIDVVLLGRPALANPHWPVWAARELGVDADFALVPEGLGLVAAGCTRIEPRSAGPSRRITHHIPRTP